MITVSSQKIPRIFDALFQFRLGDEFRLLDIMTRSREDFIGYGWRRAASEAGLDSQQTLASSCLFVTQFVPNHVSVGFYLDHDPDRYAGQIYLARPDVSMTSAMHLIRLNPGPPSFFPSTDPFLLSVFTYSEKEGPQSRSFVRLKDLWRRKNQTPDPKRMVEISSDPGFFAAYGGLKVSPVYNTLNLSEDHPLGRLILNGDLSGAVVASLGGWSWILAEEDETWSESAAFRNACPLIE